MSYNPNNLFARIIRGELAAKKIYEDEAMLAFEDIAKAAPVHILIIPKGNYRNYSDFLQQAAKAEIANCFAKIADLAENHLQLKAGYRLITNQGFDANQTIEHFHMHLLAGRPLGGLLADDKLKR